MRLFGRLNTYLLSGQRRAYALIFPRVPRQSTSNAQESDKELRKEFSKEWPRDYGGFLGRDFRGIHQGSSEERRERNRAPIVSVIALISYLL